MRNNRADVLAPRRGGRLALDSFLLLPRGDVDGLALHAGGHTVVQGTFETDRSAGFWYLPAEEEIVGIAGFGIDQNTTTGFDRFFYAAGTLNAPTLCRRVVRRLSYCDGAKTQEQQEWCDGPQRALSSVGDHNKNRTQVRTPECRAPYWLRIAARAARTHPANGPAAPTTSPPACRFERSPILPGQEAYCRV